MALNEPIPPDGVQQVFFRGLGEEMDVAQRKITLPIYALSVDELTMPGGHVSPRAAGWYFLVSSKTGFAGGEVPNIRDDPGSSRTLATSLTFGPFVSEALKAYGQVKEHPELRVQPFQLRMLRVPGLRIEAFWLKAEPFEGPLGENDRVYAFLASRPTLKSRLVSGRDFLRVARRLAKASLLIDNSPKF